MVGYLETQLAFQIATHSKGLHLESFDWGFAFGISSKACGLATGNCFFCTVQMEDNTYIFMQCQIGVTFLKFGKFYRNVFYTQTIGVHTIYAKSKIVIAFLFLRYWGLRHSWDMRNAFVFDGSESISTKAKGSTNMTIFFIAASENSFLIGVFVLPIGNSTCSTTHVVQLVGDHSFSFSLSLYRNQLTIVVSC